MPLLKPLSLVAREVFPDAGQPSPPKGKLRTGSDAHGPAPGRRDPAAGPHWPSHGRADLTA